MASEKSYASLGLFIVVTLIVVLVTAVFFIERLKNRASIAMVTYTRENVFGLDVSSSVRLRGVPVGRVTGIRVDPKGDMVEIDFEVFLDRLSTIGLDIRRLRRRIKEIDVEGVFPKTRAHIMGNPITGEAYLLLDQPTNPPPPIELGFKPSRPYIPSMPSVFSTVQDRLPALLDSADATLQTLTEIVARMPASLDRTDRFFTKTERMIHDSQLPTLSADTRKFFETTSAQVEQIRFDMDRVIGAQGTLIQFSEEARAAIKAADLPAMSESAREAADNSRLASDDLRRSLPAIRESLEQLRELSRAIEDQPESVMYGSRPVEKKH